MFIFFRVGYVFRIDFGETCEHKHIQWTVLENIFMFKMLTTLPQY